MTKASKYLGLQHQGAEIIGQRVLQPGANRNPRLPLFRVDKNDDAIIDVLASDVLALKRSVAKGFYSLASE